MGLFGALLALPVVAMLLVGWSGWQEERIRDARDVAAARKLVVLASAVERHVHVNYGTLAEGQIAIATLRNADLLPSGFDGSGDPMKRELRVWVLDAGGGRFRVASMQLVPDGDDRRPGAGVYEARGRQALGVVDGSGELGGPTIQEDLTDFRNATGAGGHPKENALVVYQEFDEESVCGDFLFRRARAGCPDAGRMETDLDLDGNDLENVGELEAERLEVADDLVVSGDFTVGGEFAVGRAVRVEGTFNVPSGLSFTGGAEFTGSVTANSVEVTGELEAASAVVSQDISARNVAASGNVTASGITSSSSINAASGYIRSLSVGNCSGC